MNRFPFSGQVFAAKFCGAASFKTGHTVGHGPWPAVGQGLAAKPREFFSERKVFFRKKHKNISTANNLRDKKMEARSCGSASNNPAATTYHGNGFLDRSSENVPFASIWSSYFLPRVTDLLYGRSISRSSWQALFATTYKYIVWNDTKRQRTSHLFLQSLRAAVDEYVEREPHRRLQEEKENDDDASSFLLAYADEWDVFSRLAENLPRPFHCVDEALQASHECDASGGVAAQSTSAAAAQSSASSVFASVFGVLGGNSARQIAGAGSDARPSHIRRMMFDSFLATLFVVC